MNRISLLLILTLVIGGCAKGPQEEALKQDIENRLNERFSAGLFQMASFDRRGHQPYTLQNQSGTGVIVYYKAGLVFTKDYELSGWDERGAGSLISLLGAAPSGVVGIKSEGNKAGDELLVYGLMTYSEQSGKWVSAPYLTEELARNSAATAQPYLAEDDVAEDRYFSGTDSWQQRLVGEIGDTFADLEKQNAKESLNALKADIESLLTRSRAEVAHSQGYSTVMSGPVSGNYFAIGSGLARVLARDQKTDIEVIPSSGAIENLELVRAGLADFALTQNDLAAMAFKGEGLFSDRGNSSLRALASIYPEALHIVSQRGSGIQSIADLQGKRVNIGAAGSGGKINAIQLLQAYNIDYSRFTQYDMETSVAAFLEGKLDALILTIGYPSKVIESLGEDFTLIAIDKNRISDLIKSHGLIAQTIPAGTYVGQAEDINTLGVTAIIVTRAEVPVSVAKVVLNTLYNNVAELSKTSVLANYIVPGSATRGVDIPLHPATELLLHKENR